jgi:hypothetical protein
MTELVLPQIGRVYWDKDLEWWQSEAVFVPWLQARITFALVAGDDDDAEAPPPLQSDVEAVTAFLNLPPSTRDMLRPHLWVNYEHVKSVGDAPEISPNEDIWSRVRPVGASTTGAHYVSGRFVIIECNCDWEPEHGLLSSFQHGKRLARVSQFDSHPTAGSAFGKPNLDDWLKGEGDLPLPRS